MPFAWLRNLVTPAPESTLAIASPLRHPWRHRLRCWLTGTATDEAVVFALLGRGWQLVAGPVTLLLVATYFHPEVQGYYYTFGSLVALQSLVDLGLSSIITNVASHEWANLRLDPQGQIAGDPAARSRLVSLGRWLFVWYGVGSALFVVAVGAAGAMFLSRAHTSTSVPWLAPWISLVLLAGGQLWAVPFNSLLEGCNQITNVMRFRLSQGVLSTVAVWFTIGYGGGLWAAVVSSAVGLLRDLYLLLVQYRRFFRAFREPSRLASLCWRTEVWPMQWRLALTGVAGYCMYSLLTPMMFRYHGPVVAGQMGMTWSLASAVQSIALSWPATKVPRFGIHVARKEYGELDRLWTHALMVALVVMTLGAGVVWMLLWTLRARGFPLAERLLPLTPTALLLLASALMVISFAQSLYLRAHKQEPLLVLSIASGLLNGFLVWLLGRHFGATGAAAGYFLTAVIAVAWETGIWVRCRRAWHR